MNLLNTLSTNVRQFPKLAVATLILGVIEWMLTAWTFGSKAANIEAVATVLLVLVAYGIIASNPLRFERCRQAADGLHQVWKNFTASTQTTDDENDLCTECQFPNSEHDNECSLNPELEESDFSDFNEAEEDAQGTHEASH